MTVPPNRTGESVTPDVPDPAPTDLDVRLLHSSPSIVGQFARGALTGARGALPGARRAGPGPALPTQRLVLTGVEQDVGRLADYCEVTGSVLADRVPATWLHVLTFPLQVGLMSGRDFPFPMLGLVHTANTMTLHRPVRVQETLSLSSWADNVTPHRRGTTVDVVGEVRVGDEVVWEGRSTYLARGRGQDGASAAEGGAAVTENGAPGASAREERRGIPERELATWRLPANLGRRYAAVSGDANPIHVSALSAKAFGFPRAIAHGMWTHARALAAVQPRLPEAYAVDAQFLKPVLLPSTVVLRGVPGTSGTVPTELAVTSRNGDRVHLTAQIRTT